MPLSKQRQNLRIVCDCEEFYHLQDEFRPRGEKLISDSVVLTLDDNRLTPCSGEWKARVNLARNKIRPKRLITAQAEQMKEGALRVL